MRKIARFCGIFCLVGTLIGIVWAIVASVNPTSTGSTASDDFVILNPLMHRVEHLFAAIGYYPAICTGLFVFYVIGAVGQVWFSKMLLALTANRRRSGDFKLIYRSDCYVVENGGYDTRFRFWIAAVRTLSVSVGNCCFVQVNRCAVDARFTDYYGRRMLRLDGVSWEKQRNFSSCIIFLAWAFFGYTIYSYSARQNRSSLSFEAR